MIREALYFICKGGEIEGKTIREAGAHPCVPTLCKSDMHRTENCFDVVYLRGADVKYKVFCPVVH